MKRFVNLVLLLFLAGIAINSFTIAPKVNLVIQPFNDLPADQLNYVVNRIKTIIPDITVAHRIALPALAYYKPRNRYRADSLISWLGRNTSGNQVIIGLTSKDIST